MSMGSGRAGFVSGSGAISHRAEFLHLPDRAREVVENKAIDISQVKKSARVGELWWAYPFLQSWLFSEWPSWKAALQILRLCVGPVAGRPLPMLAPSRESRVESTMVDESSQEVGRRRDVHGMCAGRAYASKQSSRRFIDIMAAHTKQSFIQLSLSQIPEAMSGSSKQLCPSCHKEFSVRGFTSHRKYCEKQARLKKEDQKRSMEIYSRLGVPGMLNSLSMVSRMLICDLIGTSRTQKHRSLTPSPSGPSLTSSPQMTYQQLAASDDALINMQIDDLGSQGTATVPPAPGMY